MNKQITVDSKIAKIYSTPGSSQILKNEGLFDVEVALPPSPIRAGWQYLRCTLTPRQYRIIQLREMLLTHPIPSVIEELEAAVIAEAKENSNG